MLNKFRRTIKGIKLIVQLIKDMKNDNNDIFIYAEEINDGGYVQRHNNRLLMTNGICVAGCTLTRIGFRTIPCIYTDVLFDKMTKDAQDFIIYHELGHYECHKDLILNGFERNDKMENEADYYAAQIVGFDNAVKALEELKEMIDLVGLGLNKEGVEEIDRRIEYIKNI